MRRHSSMTSSPIRHLALAAAVAAAVGLLAGCGDKPEADAAQTAAAEKPAPESFRDAPDFGNVEGVTVEIESTGPTASIAALRALDQAIAQVNGRRVSSTAESVSAGVTLDVSGLGTLAVDSDAYAERVVSSSDGAIRSFTILSSEEVERVDAEYSFNAEASSGGWLGDHVKVSESERQLSRYWKVRVKAEVAKFVGPKDDGRPSIVVAAPRTGADRYAVGDQQVDASGVAGEIRARLSDALTQTERFQVLDREFNDEMQAEVDFINSGNARNEEVARLGQRLATDLILVPTIERFAYPHSSRKLHMSNRELTSYSGGGRISLRLINATTGEVVMSESFAHELPATGPSTLARSVDGVSLAGQMMDALSSSMTKSILNEIFPVSVVALTGNQVVLSQGGKSVSIGDRYEAVVLGQALTDPQTGRSLGRMEVPCCVIRVDRVADQTSYGSIEGEIPAQLSAFKPGMVELRGLAGAKAEPATAVAATATAAAAAAAAAPKPRARSAAPAAAPAETDDADW